MLAMSFAGGLGNQLFQFAALETLARENNRTMCLFVYVSADVGHSRINYFDNIFSDFKDLPLFPAIFWVFEEENFQRIYRLPPASEFPNICFTGYFQNWEYISDSFLSRLRLPDVPSTDTAFLHVRGGDYLGLPVHDIGLQEYYKKAVKCFPEGTLFHIFTNDVEYAKTIGAIFTVPNCLVESDELIALAMMSKCSRGGICANSSFSWWGAFLDRNRTIVMPSKWFGPSSTPQTHYTEGFYFPGVIRIDID
jgi:hypothetical protein